MHIKVVIILLFSFLLFPLLNANEMKVGRVVYYKNIFGHIHQNPSRYSNSLTTIECGHPVKVLRYSTGKNKGAEVVSKGWILVKVGPYKGYIRENVASRKKPECFQTNYPRFFDGLDLELSDMYYWGRLHDLYLTGHSKVQ